MNTDQAEIKARLAGQWPKRCGCGRVYAGRHAWNLLAFAYPLDDAFALQEARHCACGSTLVILVQIHDLDQEFPS